jgi:hypothetical protein
MTSYQQKRLKEMSLGAGGGTLPYRTAKVLEALGYVTVSKQSYRPAEKVYVYWCCVLTPAGWAAAAELDIRIR